MKLIYRHNATIQVQFLELVTYFNAITKDKSSIFLDAVKVPFNKVFWQQCIFCISLQTPKTRELRIPAYFIDQCGHHISNN